VTPSIYDFDTINKELEIIRKEEPLDNSKQETTKSVELPPPDPPQDLYDYGCGMYMECLMEDEVLRYYPGDLIV
jgi:hypothetical protein